ncbi:Lyso-phosphatidylcholine acyltransferase [Coemansia sp. S610]|nr:Lyso-phosphatidylcholine acyltransferase [Coemansia sp. S610]
MSVSSEKQQPVEPTELTRPGAKELINRLPRSSWRERSFAYWAERQLCANDPWWRPLSSAVVGVSTCTMSLFHMLGFRKVVAEDLHKLTDIIEGPRDRPVITIANHESTMDDPTMWGLMPRRMRWNPDYTRWTLGAQELLYKNPPLNAFFALGQTIPTIRGDGIYQLAVEIGIQRLRENKWLHIFPEGKVNQDETIGRFKWGVGRLIMESERVPIVLPIFFTGMKEIMPLSQKVPVPRPNPFKSTLFLKVGDEIDFTAQIEEWKNARAKLSSDKDKNRLDELVRIAIVDRLWASLDKLKDESTASIARGALD